MATIKAVANSKGGWDVKNVLTGEIIRPNIRCEDSARFAASAENAKIDTPVDIPAHRQADTGGAANTIAKINAAIGAKTVAKPAPTKPVRKIGKAAKPTSIQATDEEVASGRIRAHYV